MSQDFTEESDATAVLRLQKVLALERAARQQREDELKTEIERLRATFLHYPDCAQERGLECDCGDARQIILDLNNRCDVLFRERDEARAQVAIALARCGEYIALLVRCRDSDAIRYMATCSNDPDEVDELSQLSADLDAALKDSNGTVAD